MILVAGATGTVGRALVARLAAARTPFRALVRKPDDVARLARDGVAAVVGDLADDASLDRALAGARAVFALTAPSPALPQLLGNLVAASKRAGIGRVVLHSSIGASPAASASFLRWNGLAERALQESGVPHVILRPNGFMQNFAAYYGPAVAATGRLQAYAGAEQVSVIDVRDIADVAMATLAGAGSDGDILDLTGPLPYAMAEQCALLSTKLGRIVPLVPVSEAQAWHAMIERGTPPAIAHAVIGLQHAYKTGLGALVTGTVERIAGHPARSFPDYLDEHLAAFMPQ
jgi:uncharacterized protein YbjT (DUF2867 family)